MHLHFLEDCGPQIPQYGFSKKVEFLNLHFCCVHTGEKDTTLVLFRNESWFPVNGYMMLTAMCGLLLM